MRDWVEPVLVLATQRISDLEIRVKQALRRLDSRGDVLAARLVRLETRVFPNGPPPLPPAAVRDPVNDDPPPRRPDDTTAVLSTKGGVRQRASGNPHACVVCGVTEYMLVGDRSVPAMPHWFTDPIDVGEGLAFCSTTHLNLFYSGMETTDAGVDSSGEKG